MLSFGQSVDLIVGDKAGAAWLLNFGSTLLKLGGALGEDLVVFTDLKPDVKLFDCCFPDQP